MDYFFKALVSSFLTNGLSYMGVYVLSNHNPNQGHLFDWFDNAMIPFSLAKTQGASYFADKTDTSHFVLNMY